MKNGAFKTQDLSLGAEWMSGVCVCGALEPAVPGGRDTSHWLVCFVSEYMGRVGGGTWTFPFRVTDL